MHWLNLWSAGPSLLRILKIAPSQLQRVNLSRIPPRNSQQQQPDTVAIVKGALDFALRIQQLHISSVEETRQRQPSTWQAAIAAWRSGQLPRGQCVGRWALRWSGWRRLLAAEGAMLATDRPGGAAALALHQVRAQFGLRRAEGYLLGCKWVAG